MYVPTASALTKGGYFIRRQGSDGKYDGKYDTVLSAQGILRSMVQAHEKQLAALPRRASPPVAGGVVVHSGRGSLLDLVNNGLATDNVSRMKRKACDRA